MINSISTSISGLLAASTRANTAANNIVNAYSSSTPSGSDRSTAAIQTARAYIPEKVINSSRKNGGVIATKVPITPSSLTIYNPGNPVANEKGFVNVPNVDPIIEFAELSRATHAYKANAAVLKTLSEISKTTFDIIK